MFTEEIFEIRYRISLRSNKRKWLISIGTNKWSMILPFSYTHPVYEWNKYRPDFPPAMIAPVNLHDVTDEHYYQENAVVDLQPIVNRVARLTWTAETRIRGEYASHEQRQAVWGHMIDATQFSIGHVEDFYLNPLKNHAWVLLSGWTEVEASGVSSKPALNLTGSMEYAKMAFSYAVFGEYEKFKSIGFPVLGRGHEYAITPWQEAIYPLSQEMFAYIPDLEHVTQWDVNLPRGMTVYNAKNNGVPASIFSARQLSENMGWLAANLSDEHLAVFLNRTKLCLSDAETTPSRS